jgi:nucleoside-diphosphate-sugar epimerase
MGPILVTGAAGFVGRRLVGALAGKGEQVVALDRVADAIPKHDNIKPVVADLLNPESYESALAGVDCVIHLAAITGKARPDAFRKANVDATKALIAACERAGVKRLVLMSSIAVTYKARQFYPYAESKIAAEAAARDSKLDVIIIRPTMILGPGSPIEASLVRLARMPATPVFGDGKRKIEPVDVEDVVAFIAGVARDAEAGGATVELGGPEAYTMKELLAKLRGKSGSPAFVHVPLGFTRSVLGVVEGPLLPVLPFTAGQLATFANDSIATPHPLVARHLKVRRLSPSVRAA